MGHVGGRAGRLVGALMVLIATLGVHVQTLANPEPSLARPNGRASATTMLPSVIPRNQANQIVNMP